MTSAWTYRDGLGAVGSVTLRGLLLTTFMGGVVGALLHVGAPTVLLVQFVLGAYGGYFGGGVGIMMMAVWSLLTDRTLKSFNAPRTFLRASVH